MFFPIKNSQDCMKIKYLIVRITISRLYLFENQYRAILIVNKVVSKKNRSQCN